MSEPLMPVAEPVPMLVAIGLEGLVHAWQPRASQLRPVPGLQLQAGYLPLLAGDGRSAVFKQTVRDESDESLPWNDRWWTLGVYRLTFATGVVDRLGYEPTTGPRPHLTFAPAPDGERAVVTETWSAEPESQAFDLARFRTTVSVADFSGSPARELVRFHGVPRVPDESLTTQWSPDGTKVALSVAVADEPSERAFPTLILDADTGRELSRIDQAYLDGSLSWDPDGSRLCVREVTNVARIHDLRTGHRSAITLLPGHRPPSEGRGVRRMIGFADDDRVLICSQSGKTMSVFAVHPDSDDPEPVLRWRGSPLMYPWLALTDTGVWG